MEGEALHPVALGLELRMGDRKRKRCLIALRIQTEMDPLYLREHCAI